MHMQNKKRQPHPRGFHANEKTEAKIKYVSTDKKTHEITFHNLLKTGYNMDKFIKDNSLFQRPDHNYDSLVGLLKKGSVVYDLGAYIGTFAIPMAIEGMKVHTFEAWHDNHIRCTKNCEPYDIKNYCVALSNVNKEEKGQITHCQGWINYDEEQYEKIKYVRLDDFIQSENLPYPDLIKMDIEGMESIAMHGMTNLLENIRPIWSVGYHFKMPVEVDGVAWVEVEDGGFDFRKVSELDYNIYDELGRRAKPEILQQRGGEFVFIPREKIRG